MGPAGSPLAWQTVCRNQAFLVRSEFSLYNYSMKIYISGISGTGMGPLALMAKAAGFEVCGSDLNRGAIYNELMEAWIEVCIGEQDGEFLKSKLDGLDWFCYTSALPETHAELVMAREAGVKCTKRDDLTAFLVKELGLKMIAVAGTHGKTTTTAMLVWTALRLNIPVAYIVGTTLGFAPSGAYRPGDRYFIYEADEYDRNFLKYHPWLSVITTIDYDHPDIYPTARDYGMAFMQFEKQSEHVIDMPSTTTERFELAGEARRYDAALAFSAMRVVVPSTDPEKVVEALNEFPGVGRRFEKIADGLYTDYAHHPNEIKATVEVALEQAEMDGKKGVVVIYQPHQNTRQYAVREGYKDAFLGVEKIFWLPTYLTREDSNLPVLTAEELVGMLENKDVAETSELDQALEDRVQEYLKQGHLVVLMTAGPADEWLRKKFGNL